MSNAPLDNVQDRCATLAADIDTLIHQLVRLRQSLVLPPDSLAIYEADGVPWPLELEIDAALGNAVDEELAPAADRLRRAARITAEELRHRCLAKIRNHQEDPTG